METKNLSILPLLENAYELAQYGVQYIVVEGSANASTCESSFIRGYRRAISDLISIGVQLHITTIKEFSEGMFSKFYALNKNEHVDFIAGYQTACELAQMLSGEKASIITNKILLFLDQVDNLKLTGKEFIESHECDFREAQGSMRDFFSTKDTEFQRFLNVKGIVNSSQFGRMAVLETCYYQ